MSADNVRGWEIVQKWTFGREAANVKQTRDKTRWPSAQNNNKLAEVLHLKLEKSVHLQVLYIIHTLCFTNVNSETEHISF